jgi:uncharacterized protein YxjI
VPNFLIRKQLIALGDDFWVEDETGERVYHVDGKVARLRDTYVIETADGQELVKIIERKLSLHKSLRVERQGQELATVSKALLNPLRDTFRVEIVGGGVLVAKGDLFDHEFTIAWENGVPMAQVSKRLFSVRESYGLSVEPNQDVVLALAVAVCIDALERD